MSMQTGGVVESRGGDTSVLWNAGHELKINVQPFKCEDNEQLGGDTARGCVKCIGPAQRWLA